MPARSKVLQLPEAIKAELDRRLVAGGFSDYEALSTWLAEQGFEVGKSSIHRYGERFETQLGAVRLATEQARAIAEAAGDDEGHLNDALIRLVQQKIFELLVHLNTEDVDASFADLGHVVAKLSRATIDQKKWQTEVRKKLDERLGAMEADAKAGKTELDLATLQRIRQEVYGMGG
jgi:hypothetical protein